MGVVTKVVKGRIVKKAADELALRLADSTELAIDELVRRRSDSIRRDVDVMRLQHPRLAAHELADRLIEHRQRKAAAHGAVTALPGVIPGIGTAAEVGASLADAALVIYDQIALTLALAVVHGRDLDDHEHRRLDVLLVLALEAGVAKRKHGVLQIDGKPVESKGLDRDALARLNNRLGAQVLKHVARRKARAFLGREVPFGVGVAVGAASNYRALKSVGRTALSYFA